MVRDEIRNLWVEAFGSSPEWIEFFFTKSYSDDQPVVGRLNERLVSSLLLQPYQMSFHGAELPTAYLCGAATYRKHRGKGYMSRLLRAALEEARNRGYAFVTLIPAHDWLYDFYSRVGFETVFYSTADRYTAVHPFPVAGKYHDYSPLDLPTVYNAFSRFEKKIHCRILHTYNDFLNVLEDFRLSKGHVAIVADETDKICSMAFAMDHDDCVVVTDLLGNDHDSQTAALRSLRRHYPDKPFKVLSPAPETENTRVLSPRGMLYTVNVKTVLEALAKADPRWRCTLRIHDDILPANSGIYRVKSGNVVELESASTFDFDLSQSVFSGMLFSSEKMGDLLGFPSQRPSMALMLD